MGERDSYLVPYYRQSVRLAKPILVYWGILAGSAVFGLNEFGSRIVGVGMALAAMSCMFYGISLLRGRQAGLISALVLGTVPQFYFISRQAMPDVYLFTSMGVGLLFFALGLHGPERRRTVHFAVSYACLSLAVLAKGPVIVGAIFVGALGLYALIQIDLREFWLPGRKVETSLFIGTTIPTLAIAAGLGFTAFLFGTSPNWWGSWDGARQDMALLRNQIFDSFERAHLATIVLVLVILGAAKSVILLIKRGRRSGRLPLVAGAFPVLGALIAVLSLFWAEGGTRILIASLLGTVGCVCGGVYAASRLLRQEWLWPIARPWLKPIGRQLLLFLIVFLVVAGPWHVAIFFSQGDGYFTDFIIKHNVNRVGDVVNRSGVSDFYTRVLIFGYFPWSCFLPIALFSLVGWWDREALRRHGLEAYLLIVSFVTFVAFTGAATKFAHYLSPLLVPLSALIGLAISRTLDRRHTVASRLSWIAAAMLFLLVARDVLDEDGAEYLVGSFTMKSFVPEALAPGTYYEGLVIAAGVCLFASIVARSRILLAGLMASAVLMANYSTAIFIPELSRHKTMKSMCETWKEAAPDGDPPICFYGDMKHGIFFYTEHRIQKMDSRQDFQTFMDPAKPAYCIVERATLNNLKLSHRTRHPGAKLEIADGSHFKYLLIRNFDARLPAD
jgi:hypothetical protein